LVLDSLEVEGKVGDNSSLVAVGVASAIVFLQSIGFRLDVGGITTGLDLCGQTVSESLDLVGKIN